MRFRRFIKNFDLFGHPINLRFNGKGESHQTILGGLLTVCLYVFMAVYTMQLFL